MTILRAFVGVAMGAGLLVSASEAGADGPSRRSAVNGYSPAIDWSGFYVGVHGGWIRPDIQTTDAAIFGEPFPTIEPNSAALGFQVGMQRQFGNLVVGLEGGLTAPVGNHYDTKDFVTLPGDDTVFRAGIENIWYVGPRFGYAMGNWMPYVTGGYASTAVKAQNIQFGIPVVLWDERMHGGIWALVLIGRLHVTGRWRWTIVTTTSAARSSFPTSMAPRIRLMQQSSTSGPTPSPCA